ncbi:MAG TPA: 23S rRNA (guanosine(2251)-2'-O)-methyltransferase RlmB [Candidatus Binataceae bacterium]|nr:23S rRNA (guanosine(2251)-2'-O)-methyltransferase RlmB [Candidatus Binataceae bacterium]
MRRRPDLSRSISIRRSFGSVASRQRTEKRQNDEIRTGAKEPTEIIFGVEPVREMIAAAPARIRRLYIKSDTEARFAPEIEAVRQHGGRILVLAGSELARIAGSDTRHQGIVAAIDEYSYVPFEELLEHKLDPLVLVDGVTDPRNLGALLRSAECAGIRGIVLAKDRTVGLTPAAIKSSAGAWVHLLIGRCGNVAHTLESLKQEGYWIAAMDPGGDTSLYDLDVSRCLTLVLGSEGRGLRDIVRRTADYRVRIPLHGRTTSLNVSVAGAITLFEIVRQRAALNPSSVNTK